MQINHYNILDKQLMALFGLVNFLTPNSRKKDMDYIQKNIKVGLKLQKQLAEMSVWKSLQSIYFNFGKEDTRKLLKIIKMNLQHPLEKWDRNYNKETFEKSEHELFLYDSTELKHLIYQTDGALRVARIDVKNFEELYFGGKAKPDVELNKKRETASLRTFNGSMEALVLKNLHKVLIKHGFIASDTRPESFQLIFSGVPLTEIKKPVKWIDKNIKNGTLVKTTLLYFIQLLGDLINPNYYFDPATRNKIIVCAFRDIDGNDFKNLKDTTVNSKAPRAALLKKVITPLLPPR